jgi:hypothetical protein
MKKLADEYSEKEATARFEAALKSALNTRHKPLKEKPKKRGTPKDQVKERTTKS